MSGMLLMQVVTGLLVGLLLGSGYFALLYRAVRLHEDGAAARSVLWLHASRGVLAIGAFWGLAQLGAWALMTGLGGFLVARTFAQRLVAGS